MWKYYAISLLLHVLFLSTYWGWINKFFNVAIEDKVWFNWLLHGFGIGLAMMPFALVGLSWVLILIRAVILGFVMMVWSDSWDIDWVEEMGRGASIILTLPILLL